MTAQASTPPEPSTPEGRVLRQAEPRNGAFDFELPTEQFTPPPHFDIRGHGPMPTADPTATGRHCQRSSCGPGNNNPAAVAIE